MSVLTTYVYPVFMMLGGLAVFMFGMKMMGDNLERVAGGKMRRLLGKFTNNKFAGVGVGCAVTCLIQSSSATTVMLVGFVNVGILSLVQAVPIIMGANIGTTITAQIASLSSVGGAVNVTAIFALFACVGVFLTMFSAKDGVKRLGMIMAGLGMLFIGLGLMSDSMRGFSEIESVKQGIASIANPFLLVFIGMIFTAVIQSSSAATGILISLVSAGLMGIDAALFFVLGTNIGTCITAMLASIGTNLNARRTAVIHLLFNVVGTVIIFIPMFFLRTQVAVMLQAISGDLLARQLANFHTIFNVLSTVLLLPFTKGLVFLSEKLVREKKLTPEQLAKQKGNQLEFLDERFLDTPPIAVAQALKEVTRMGQLASENLEYAVGMLFDYTPEKLEQVNKNEERIDFLNRGITAFLVQISSLDLPNNDEKIIGTLYHVVSDIERIGDYAVNVSEYAEKMQREGIAFSEDARNDVAEMYSKVKLLYRDTMYTFERRDKKMLPEIARREDEIDSLKLLMADNHVARLNKGLCTAESGAIYLSLSSNLERVADHLTNVAYSIRSYTGSMNDMEKMSV